jgi:methionine synthase II (cobalamin-independent)
MEILTRSVMKKEATDLENAGMANLQIREKPLEEEKSDSEDEGPQDTK